MSRAAPAFGTLSELAENHKNRGKQHRNNQKVICVLRRSTDRSIRNCRHVTPSGQSNTHSILPQQSAAQHSTSHIHMPGASALPAAPSHQQLYL